MTAEHQGDGIRTSFTSPWANKKRLSQAFVVNSRSSSMVWDSKLVQTSRLGGGRLGVGHLGWGRLGWRPWSWRRFRRKCLIQSEGNWYGFQEYGGAGRRHPHRFPNRRATAQVPDLLILLLRTISAKIRCLDFFSGCPLRRLCYTFIADLALGGRIVNINRGMVFSTSAADDEYQHHLSSCHHRVKATSLPRLVYRHRHSCGHVASDLHPRRPPPSVLDCCTVTILCHSSGAPW